MEIRCTFSESAASVFVTLNVTPCSAGEDECWLDQEKKRNSPPSLVESKSITPGCLEASNYGASWQVEVKYCLICWLICMWGWMQLLHQDRNVDKFFFFLFFFFLKPWWLPSAAGMYFVAAVGDSSQMPRNSYKPGTNEHLFVCVRVEGWVFMIEDFIDLSFINPFAGLLPLCMFPPLTSRLRCSWSVNLRRQQPTAPCHGSPRERWECTRLSWNWSWQRFIPRRETTCFSFFVS